MKKRKSILRFIFPLLTILVLIFIFSNSLSSAEESSMQSHGIAETAEKIVRLVLGENEITSNLNYTHIVRKLAHFSEFALLGFLAFLSLFYNMLSSSICRLAAAFFGLICAVSDEYLQAFSPGRSSEINDALLDFGGVVFGILIGGIIKCIIEKRRKAS